MHINPAHGNITDIYLVTTVANSVHCQTDPSAREMLIQCDNPTEMRQSSVMLLVDSYSHMFYMDYHDPINGSFCYCWLPTRWRSLLRMQWMYMHSASWTGCHHPPWKHLKSTPTHYMLVQMFCFQSVCSTTTYLLLPPGPTSQHFLHHNKPTPTPHHHGHHLVCIQWNGPH
jgi:hypothetical protein